jgi:hypothetical protein
LKFIKWEINREVQRYIELLGLVIYPVVKSTVETLGARLPTIHSGATSPAKSIKPLIQAHVTSRTGAKNTEPRILRSSRTSDFQTNQKERPLLLRLALLPKNNIANLIGAQSHKQVSVGSSAAKQIKVALALYRMAAKNTESRL